MFINFQDEILGGEVKFRIRDNNGNIIYDNVTIELVSEIIKTGSPINRNNFNRVQNFYDSEVTVDEEGKITEISGDLIQTTVTDEEGNIIESTTQDGITMTKTTSVDDLGVIKSVVTEN